jgi:excisionase family DNA binding protein
MADKLLYTVQEAASRLGMAPSWLYQRTRINAVPHRKMGKYVRFSESDLEAIISANAAAARNDCPPERTA